MERALDALIHYLTSNSNVGSHMRAVCIESKDFVFGSAEEDDVVASDLNGFCFIQFQLFGLASYEPAVRVGWQCASNVLTFRVVVSFHLDGGIVHEAIVDSVEHNGCCEEDECGVGRVEFKQIC